jgi:glyoxylate reductase
VHIPLNEQNRKFLSKEKLNLIDKNAVFINTSRGGIVDEKTLIKLLKLKKINFAGLDVFENEPEINPDFLTLENAILTNHTAGKTKERRVKMSKDIFQQIKNYYEKKEL